MRMPLPRLFRNRKTAAVTAGVGALLIIGMIMGPTDSKSIPAHYPQTTATPTPTPSTSLTPLLEYVAEGEQAVISAVSSEITNVGKPDHGTARLKAGTIIYTPKAGFTGSDVFAYWIGKNRSRVEVTVYERSSASPDSDSGGSKSGGIRGCVGGKRLKICT